MSDAPDAPVAPAAEHPYRALTPKPARASALAVPPIDADLRPSSTGTATRSYWATFFAAALVWYVGLALVDASSPAMPLLWLSGVLVSFLVARVFDQLVFAKRALATFNRGVVAAGALASRGQIDEAEQRHRAIFRASRGRRGLEALALHNVAAMRIRRGDDIGALRILYAIFDYAGSKQVPGAQMRIAGKITTLLARVGEVKEARRWLALMQKAAGKMQLYSGNLVALILAREGQFAEAEAAYEAEWPDIERVCAVEEMRSIRASRAFVLARLGKDAETVRRMVDGARSTLPGELRHLGVGWDEMMGFLREQGLVKEEAD